MRRARLVASFLHKTFSTSTVQGKSKTVVNEKVSLTRYQPSARSRHHVPFIAIHHTLLPLLHPVNAHEGCATYQRTLTAHIDFCSSSQTFTQMTEAAGPSGKKFKVLLGGPLKSEQAWKPGIAKAVEGSKANPLKPVVPNWVFMSCLLGSAVGIYSYTVYMLGPGTASLRDEMLRAEEELKAQGIGRPARS